MSKLFIILAVIFSTNVMANCKTDKQLENIGFTVHRDLFDVLFLQGETWLSDNQHDFVDHLSGTIFSTVANQMVTVESFDYLPTPQDEMFGDLVLMTSFRDGYNVEVRWYENGQRHFAVSKQAKCAIESIPFAVNSLY